MQQIPCETNALEGFDFSRGLERLQGNRGLYMKLLCDFSDRYRNCSSEVKDALDLKNREKAHQMVHNLKGIAGNLSATDLYEAARVLDERLKVPIPDWSEIEKQFSVFRNVLERAVRSVDGLGKAYRNSCERPGLPEGISVDRAADVARNIRESVELGDIMAIIELSDNASLDTVLQDRISGLVDDFDLDGLSNLADELERWSKRKPEGG